MRCTDFVGTELQLRALNELRCPDMKKLCKLLTPLSSDEGRAAAAVSFSRPITIGDIVVLDRACSFSKKSVVSLIQQIDPSETKADTQKLTMTIRKLIDVLLKKAKLGLRLFSDASIKEVLAAQFRLVPRPQLRFLQSGKAPPIPELKHAEPEVQIIIINSKFPKSHVMF